MTKKPTIIQLGYKRKPQDKFMATFVSSTIVLGKEVQLISVIEIQNEYHPARTTGTELTQAFSRYFTRSSHQSTLTKFEDALKGCNTIIESAIKTLDSPINCAVMAIAGSDVYLSTLGNAKIYLRRDGRLNQVSARIQETVKGQFASVTNGEILQSDWLFMANEELVNYLQEFEQDLPDDALELENQIKNFYAKFPETNLCGALINIEPEHPFQITLYLDEVEKKIPISLPKVSLPAFEAPNFNFSKFKNIFANIFNRTKNIKLLSLISNIKIKRLIKLPNFKPRYLKLIGAVVVIILIVLFFRGSNKNENSDKKPVTVNPLIAQISLPTPKISDVLNDLNETNYLALSETERLNLVKILSANNLTLITSSNVLNKFEQEIVTSDAYDDLIIVVDAQNELWKFKDTKFEKIELKNPIKDIASATIVYNDLILITTKDFKYWKITPSLNSATEINILPALANTQLLFETYNSNLYAYNPKNNTVYRAQNFNGDLTKLLPYTRAGVLKNNSVSSFAINGDIITISQNASMEIFVRNINRLFVKRSEEISQNYIVASIPKVYRASNNEISSHNDKTLVQDKQKYIYFTGSKITSLSYLNNKILFSIGKELFEINL